MMAKRNVIGYTIGFILFVILIPAIMYIISQNINYSPLKICIALFLSILGLCVSIWAIAYMQKVGKGNPMDAFNHELAPRTQKLMTEGPYKFCRNPMLLGIFIYYIGIIVLLASFNATIIFVIFTIIITYQVHCEEKRLEKDFGEAYIEYKNKTKKLIPFVW